WAWPVRGGWRCCPSWPGCWCCSPPCTWRAWSAVSTAGWPSTCWCATRWYSAGPRPPPCSAARVAGDELAHLRVHLLAPAATAENAVMPRALHREVAVARLGDAGAQVVRGAGLAQARDVVQLALDGHQRAAPDRRRPHRLAADGPLAQRQEEVLEHGADGVQVVLGGHVQHRVVLVVELAVGLGVLQVALDQVGIEVPVRHEVAAGIHRHEPRVLQEARVDRAP